MRKLLLLSVVLVFAGCREWPWMVGNVVVNPGFDMTPWDTGWTIETDTATDPPNPGSAIAIAEVKIDTGMSFPNSGFLRTEGHVFNQGLSAGSARAKAMVSQTFDKIIGCEIKAYVKFHIAGEMESFPAIESVNIQVLVNNEWKTIWEVSAYYYFPGGDTLDTIWAEVCTTIVNDTVSGIRFCASSSCFLPSNGGNGSGWADFWIDNVYVGK